MLSICLCIIDIFIQIEICILLSLNNTDLFTNITTTNFFPIWEKLSI